jgi:hypothetical protein
MLFYFDTLVDGELVSDGIGTPLPDIDAARAKATEGIASMAKDAILQGAKTVEVIVRANHTIVARSGLRIS